MLGSPFPLPAEPNSPLSVALDLALQLAHDDENISPRGLPGAKITNRTATACDHHPGPLTERAARVSNCTGTPIWGDDPPPVVCRLVDLPLPVLHHLISSNPLYARMAEDRTFWSSYLHDSFSSGDTAVMLAHSNEQGEINYQRVVVHLDYEMALFKPRVDTSTMSLPGERNLAVTLTGFPSPSVVQPLAPAPLSRFARWLGNLRPPGPALSSGSPLLLPRFTEGNPPGPISFRPIRESVDKALELGLDVWLARYGLTVSEGPTGEPASLSLVQRRLHLAVLSGSVACVCLFPSTLLAAEHLHTARTSGSVAVYRHVHTSLRARGFTVEVESPALLYSICCARDDVVSFRTEINANPLAYYHLAVRRRALRILRVLCEMLASPTSEISHDPRPTLFSLAVECNNFPAVQYLSGYITVTPLTLDLTNQSSELLNYLVTRGWLLPTNVSCATTCDPMTRDWWIKWMA